MTRLSNWKEESDLFEVVTGKMTDKEALKKVDEKKGIKNKVVINPKLTETIKNMGGELIEATEEDGNVNPADEAKKKSEEQKKKQIENKQKRAQMIKKQVLMKKLIAVRSGSEDIVAHHEPEGEVLDERLGGKGYSRKAAASSVYPGKKGTGDWEDSDRGAGNKAARRAGKKVEKKSPTYRAHVLNKESVEFSEEKKKGLDGKACWKGYRLAGTKKKGGKTVDNCVKEDKALEIVRANIIKKHGKGAIYDPKKKQSSQDKAKVAAERKKRQDADNKAYAARAKKAGFKSTQDYTNVVARYGSEDNYKKGRGLGT